MAYRLVTLEAGAEAICDGLERRMTCDGMVRITCALVTQDCILKHNSDESAAPVVLGGFRHGIL